MHVIISFFSVECVYQSYFTHSAVGGHLGWFHVLVIMNSAAVNISVQVFLCNADLASFRHVIISCIDGHVIVAFACLFACFWCLRNLHISFHSTCLLRFWLQKGLWSRQFSKKVCNSSLCLYRTTWIPVQTKTLFIPLSQLLSRLITAPLLWPNTCWNQRQWDYPARTGFRHMYS